MFVVGSLRSFVESLLPKPSSVGHTAAASAGRAHIVLVHSDSLVQVLRGGPEFVADTGRGVTALALNELVQPVVSAALRIAAERPLAAVVAGVVIPPIVQQAFSVQLHTLLAVSSGRSSKTR